MPEKIQNQVYINANLLMFSTLGTFLWKAPPYFTCQLGKIPYNYRVGSFKQCKVQKVLALQFNAIRYGIYQVTNAKTFKIC